MSYKDIEVQCYGSQIGSAIESQRTVEHSGMHMLITSVLEHKLCTPIRVVQHVVQFITIMMIMSSVSSVQLLEHKEANLNIA